MKIALFLLLLVSCSHTPSRDETDFRALMGDAKAFVKTQEDEHNLALYQAFFEAVMPLHMSIKEERIPKTIHFIWIGPSDLPKKSRKTIRSWIAKHPGWSCKLWTDLERAIPIPGLTQEVITTSDFSCLRKEYKNSLSLIEKTHILRYEILHREGGVYVDCDVQARRSFTALHESVDFYCGLEPLHPSVLSSCVVPALHVIGSAPRHPILDECLKLIAQRWEPIEHIFPGDDTDSSLYRISYRTIAPFEEAIKLQFDREEYRNIVLPAAYFSNIDNRIGLYASHDRERSWLMGKTKFERDLRKQVETLDTMYRWLLLCTFLTLFFALVIFTLIFLQRRELDRR